MHVHVWSLVSSDGFLNAQVGVGVGSAKEVVNAVTSAGKDAKKNLIKVPITRNFSFPHRIDGEAGAAKVMLRPASEGTGVIAGGAVRVVLEMAGIKNAFGKQLGSGNPLNNARATVDGLSRMRTFEQVAELRGLTVSELMGFRKGMTSAGPPTMRAATAIVEFIRFAFVSVQSVMEITKARSHSARQGCRTSWVQHSAAELGYKLAVDHCSLSPAFVKVVVLNTSTGLWRRSSRRHGGGMEVTVCAGVGLHGFPSNL